MERAVGWFVLFALALLAFGFAYYVYNTAERKGWFLTKARYFAYLEDAAGLKVGDPVKLMGFDAGAITDITPMAADQFSYNVYVEFELKAPNMGYMWTEGSRVKVNTADLLGKRVLEVTRGTNGYPTYIFNPLREAGVGQMRDWAALTNWYLAQEILAADGSNLLYRAKTPITAQDLSAIAEAGYDRIRVMDLNQERKMMTGIWNRYEGRYEFYTNKTTKPYWLMTEETPAVTEQLERLVSRVQQALPGVFGLTNQLIGVLANSSNLASNLNAIAVEARPAVSNLAMVSAKLDRPGAVGEMLLPPTLSRQLESAVGSADATLVSANTNLAALAANLSRSLDNLASMTSNLNNQVEANTNMLSQISRTIVDADQFVQGLKRHWLLRSAFKEKANAKETPPSGRPAAPVEKLRSPKEER
jgi:ABC-type transporter Mla subunit MlaD